MERMTPEARARYEKRVKTVMRNRKILAGFVAVVVIACVCVLLSITVLFNVSSIKVANKSKKYSEKDIISASGLDIGDNMIRTNFDDAENRIETMLPYILTAEIKKSISGAVTITVKDNTPSMIFEVKNGYAIADADGKVLEILAEKPEETNLMVLTTSQELSANPGQYIGFADEKEAKLYETICNSLKKVGLYKHITALDLSSPLNIKIVYQNRLRIKIGDTSDIDSKLTAAAKTIEEENASNPNTIAEINATILKKVYVNPLDSLEEKPEDEKTETTDEEKTSVDNESEESEDGEENESASDEDTNAEEEEENDEGSDENSENESENEENQTEEE